METSKRILVSFNHSVAIMLDGRVIFIGAAVCEELFQAEVALTPKKGKIAKPTAEEAVNDATKLTLDFPMFLRILSLADGKLLKEPVEILVKWNNISAICSLRAEL